VIAAFPGKVESVSDAQRGQRTRQQIEHFGRSRDTFGKRALNLGAAAATMKLQDGTKSHRNQRGLTVPQGQSSIAAPPPVMPRIHAHPRPPRTATTVWIWLIRPRPASETLFAAFDLRRPDQR